jgi:ABC-type Mn2+/Zn2+ transport system ATPase subunit
VSAPEVTSPEPERVQLHRASVRLGSTQVLHDVSLDLAEGEYVCVRGANGAGKTTLLRVLAGALPLTRGTRVGPRSCAYVPPALAPPPITVAGWLGRVRRRRVDDPLDALSRLGFDGDEHASCRALSFGNLRKVLLADAFTAATPLLAVDEVHVGLDHTGRVGLEHLIGRARDRGAIIVVAAQDDDPVDGTDRTLVAGNGRVTDAAPASDVVHRTLRGPRAAVDELLDAAERLGFRPVEGDDR